MRTITIIGAGQAGLHLGIGLVDAGYEVRIVSNRSAEEIANGRVTSSQVIMGVGRAREQALGLDFWKSEAPVITGTVTDITDGNGARVMSYGARFDLPAQSIDQRVKMPRWMDEFTRRGGQLEVRDANVDDLEGYAKSSDLVIVAAGKGEIARIFERDAVRSTFDVPQRTLAVAYLKGMQPRSSSPQVVFGIHPGVGEYLAVPALTTSGPCDIIILEALPGGPTDVFAGMTDPQQILEQIRSIVNEYMPWEGERIRDAELTDAGGVLTGAFASVVRKPVGVLPSGATVLGIADVVVLNDPITGQGSNNAAKAAASYLASILEHGDRPYDDKFKIDTFERAWDHVQYSARATDTFLLPPSQEMLNVLGAAAESPRVAARFVNSLDEPRDFGLWLLDPGRSAEYLQELSR
ncbi:styrene monooxygenase/indole monooxygenase family protein [Nocardia sp. R6R-6]|uniref:styrene monooxygenase/indole monooxygenase family protein n=1 Tax=Nocardia sp. R6R-6 TaxID=3459303 RepID=UPI00403DBA99